LDVLVYYWDDRDGPNFCGWWFGPKVGGDQVWAYNSERGMAPPTTGWRVPYDGPVDMTFVVSPAQVSHSQAQQAQQQPQQGYGAQQQQQGYYAAAQQQHLQQQQLQQQQQQQQMQAYYGQQQEEQRLRQQEQQRRQQQLEVLRQQQLDNIRRQEAERKQKEEEQRLKREEDERRRLEQHSCLVARKAIQKVRNATPEDFDALKLEVNGTLALELPKCGLQADRIRMDYEQQLEQARQRVEGVREARRKEEERRQEEERLRKEQEETTAKNFAELQELVGKVETGVERLKQLGAPAEEGKDLEPDDSKVFWEVVTESKVACKACTDFVVTNRSTMEKGLLAAPAPPELGNDGKPAPVDAREELLKLQARVLSCLKTILTNSMTVQAIHAKAVKKMKAMRVFEKRALLFDKYDKDKDGLLNRKEISSYAKGEFGFGLPQGVLPRILAVLGDARGGVPKDRFHRLRVVVGIAREEEASRERQREAEERAKILQEKKAALQADVSKVTDSLTELEPEVAKAEEKVQPLVVDDLSVVEKVAEALEEADAQLQAARDEAAAVRRQIEALGGDSDEALAPFVQAETKQLGDKATAMESRLQQVEDIVLRGRGHLAKVEKMELESLSVEVVKALKDHISTKKLSVEDCFSAADKDQDGVVGKADFVACISGLEQGRDHEAEKLERLFGHLAGEDRVSIDREAFLRLLLTHYRVAKETLITTEMAIKEGKTLRRLDVDEVFAVHEGPVKDETLGILRVRGRALKDGCQGWATEVGNTGGVFLEAGEDRGAYGVLRPQPLTAGFEPEGGETLRELQEGDKLEVLEWDKEHEASGVVRMRVKVVEEGGLSGWVTKMLSDETPLLKLLWRPLKAASNAASTA